MYKEHDMSQIDKVLYTGKTHTTGGRSGVARSADGRLDISLSPPGSTGSGTNPEQLFAAGWSACFIGAMGLAAQARGIALPTETAVDAEVDLGTGEGGYFLQARLRHRRCRPPDLPLFQGDARQHRRGAHPRLIPPRSLRARLPPSAAPAP
jgi:lipoyl-dependent peroxiredoxin